MTSTRRRIPGWVYLSVVHGSMVVFLIGAWRDTHAFMFPVMCVVFAIVSVGLILSERRHRAFVRAANAVQERARSALAAHHASWRYLAITQEIKDLVVSRDLPNAATRSTVEAFLGELEKLFPQLPHVDRATHEGFCAATRRAFGISGTSRVPDLAE